MEGEAKHLAIPLSTFDSIYVATIDRNEKRQEKLRQIANEHGLHLNFVRGTDGQNLGTKYFASAGTYDSRRAVDTLGYELTCSEIACSMTHQAILKEFLRDRSNKCALVLEDDVNIVSENSAQAELTAAFSVLKGMPAWDVLYLGYEEMNRRMPRSIYVKYMFMYPMLNAVRLKKYDRPRIRRCFGEAMNKYWFRAGVHNGAYAYAVSRRGAEKILECNTPIWAQADVVLMHLIRSGAVTAYALERKVFDHDWTQRTSIGERASWN